MRLSSLKPIFTSNQKLHEPSSLRDFNAASDNRKAHLTDQGSKNETSTEQKRVDALLRYHPKSLCGPYNSACLRQEFSEQAGREFGFSHGAKKQLFLKMWKALKA